MKTIAPRSGLPQHQIMQTMTRNAEEAARSSEFDRALMCYVIGAAGGAPLLGRLALPEPDTRAALDADDFGVTRVATLGFLLASEEVDPETGASLFIDWLHRCTRVRPPRAEPNAYTEPRLLLGFVAGLLTTDSLPDLRMWLDERLAEVPSTIPLHGRIIAMVGRALIGSNSAWIQLERTLLGSDPHDIRDVVAALWGMMLLWEHASPAGRHVLCNRREDWLVHPCWHEVEALDACSLAFALSVLDREINDLPASKLPRTMGARQEPGPVMDLPPTPPSTSGAAPVTTPQYSPAAITSPTDHKGQVDFAILTIRDDEFQAVLDRFPPFKRTKGRRVYNFHRLDLPAGGAYLVAVLKCIEQGNTEALDAARDVLEELEPRWLLVVGIAGSVPSDELTLGDVVVSTRIVDFSVEAVIQDRASEYALMGGPVHKEAAAILANLRALSSELHGWGSAMSIGAPRPTIELDDAEFYGDEAWQKKARAGLARQVARTEPIVTAGAIGSSDRLVKDTKILATFLIRAARQVLAVEMESAGVYRAASGRGVPSVAIRGLSDVVGFKRDPGWTAYACHSAAAFTQAFLRTRPIEPQLVGPVAPREQAPAPRWPAKLSGQELQDLVNALLSAFPSRSALAQMLRFSLDKNLDEIVGAGNLRVAIFELVSHAEAHGYVPALFNAALDAVPGNPELVALAARRSTVPNRS